MAMIRPSVIVAASIPPRHADWRGHVSLPAVATARYVGSSLGSVVAAGVCVTTSRDHEREKRARLLIGRNQRAD